MRSPNEVSSTSSMIRGHPSKSRSVISRVIMNASWGECWTASTSYTILGSFDLRVSDQPFVTDMTLHILNINHEVDRIHETFVLFVQPNVILPMD